MNSTSKSIFNLQFWLLCMSSFLFFVSFNMLIPELPDYLSSLGGEDYKGLIIALFTVTAAVSRPFSGKLTDRIGRVPVMAFGSLVCFVCGFIYPLTTTVFPFLFLRLVHGFSTGFKPTGTSAYIADIIPDFRRGEAMGMHGLVSSLGMAFGPALGSWIASEFSMNILFYTSSIFAFLSIAILANMKETLPTEQKEKFRLSSLKITKKDIFDIDVIPAAIVIFLTGFSYGAVVTLTPDLSKSIGIHNKGYFFMIFTLASLLIRLLAGKVSDRKGRVPVLLWGCGSLILSMTAMSFANNIYLLTLGGIFFGIGWGMLSPILLAWTVDLSQEENRGRGLATMYISMETGIGLGAFSSGLIYGNDLSRMPISFIVMGVLAFIALGYLYSLKRKSHQSAIANP